jgi:hypothetical protein
METIDDESLAAAKDFIRRQHEAGQPFFCWWNGTRMHFRCVARKLIFESGMVGGLSLTAFGRTAHDFDRTVADLRKSGVRARARMERSQFPQRNTRMPRLAPAATAAPAAYGPGACWPTR